MCSSVWSWLSPVFSWKFACYLYPLTLKKTFHSNFFFEKWNGNEKPKKNLRKESWERTSGTTKWDKLGQVGVRGTSGTRRRGSSDLSRRSGTRRRGSSDLRGTSGTRTRGLSTWTSPLVPNGTTRPFNLSHEITWIRNKVKSGDQAVFEMKSLDWACGKWLENWSCYRRNWVVRTPLIT